MAQVQVLPSRVQVDFLLAAIVYRPHGVPYSHAVKSIHERMAAASALARVGPEPLPS